MGSRGEYLVAAALLLCGCGDDSDGAGGADASARECVPFAQQACECDGEPVGAQTCSAAARWERCACPDDPAPGLASDIRIRELAVFQVVKIPLAVDGVLIQERNAPVVQGKDLMLRVYVETGDGWRDREVRVELTLRSSSELVSSQEIVQRIEGDSQDGVLESTVNFELPGAMVTGDLRYAVAIREVEGEPPSDAVDDNARFPTDDDTTVELGARWSGPLRVMLVPYRYNFDGSGRLPAIAGESGEGEVSLYRQVLEAIYPVSKVEVELHEPVDYEGEITATGGWEELLTALCELRVAEDPDPRLLYYGAVAPAEGWADYGGGVAGVSNVPFASGEFGRCSVGIGFGGSVTTVMHELGHAMGRPHAPCGTPGEAFPYEEAKIGVWGYGSFSGMLKDPETNYDMMSYCNPPHLSDYNYRRIFERNRFINLEAYRVEGEPIALRRLLVTADGRASWGELLDFGSAPGGSEHERELRFSGEGGEPLGTATGYYFPYSEEGAGAWLIPPAPDGAVQVSAEALGTAVMP